MSEIWTGLRERGAHRAWVLLALLLAGGGILVAACSGKASEPNVIKPIHAGIALSAVTADPAVYFANPSVSDPTQTGATDFVTLDVLYRDSTPRNFDAFTLEVHFDPGVVQIGEVSGLTALGDCGGSTCQPICQNNVTQAEGANDANRTGVLLIGIGRQTSCPPAATLGGAGIRLLTLGFIAATTTGPSPIRLVYNLATSRDGECEILQYPSASGNPFVDLKVPCYDGGAVLTAQR